MEAKALLDFLKRGTTSIVQCGQNLEWASGGDC